jgi:hypothetical protein
MDFMEEFEMTETDSFLIIRIKKCEALIIARNTAGKVIWWLIAGVPLDHRFRVTARMRLISLSARSRCLIVRSIDFMRRRSSSSLVRSLQNPSA